MKKEEKLIVIKDLCARLPCNVKIKVGRKQECVLSVGVLFDIIAEGTIPKPYLRPMSSLTKEERLEIGKAIQKDRINPSGEIKDEGSDNLLLCTVRQSTNLIDWLNGHHLDYRGLIKKGLALKAPDGMYDTKQI